MFPETWESADDRYDAREIIEEQFELLAWAQEKRLEVLRNGFGMSEVNVANASDRNLSFNVEISNLTDAHYTPSSFDIKRTVFVHVTVIDAAGNVVYQSGARDPNGDLHDAHSRSVSNDLCRKTTIYSTFIPRHMSELSGVLNEHRSRCRRFHVLRYRPYDHADRFMHGWMEFAKLPTASASALAKTFRDEKLIGGCANCHGTGEGAWRKKNWHVSGVDLNFTVNGRGGLDEQLLSQRRNLIGFSHFSHQQAVATNGCGQCHQIATSEARSVKAGFELLGVEACTACHNQVTGLDRCTNCHQYYFRFFDDTVLYSGWLFEQRLQQTVASEENEEQ